MRRPTTSPVLQIETNRAAGSGTGIRDLHFLHLPLAIHLFEVVRLKFFHHLAGGIVSLHQHRPAGHYGSGKYSQRVKPSAPRHPGRKPDLDKLVRAVFDSLTSIVWIDDAQVVRLTAMKRYIDRWEEEGVAIHVSTYEA